MKLKIGPRNWLIPILIGIVGYALLHFYTGSSRILSGEKRELEEHIDATEALMQKAIDIEEQKNTGQPENKAKQSGTEPQQTQDKLQIEDAESEEASQAPSESSARPAK